MNWAAKNNKCSNNENNDSKYHNEGGGKPERVAQELRRFFASA
jgi:hypothetical protein